MDRIERIRAFNRFYTNQIGLLDRAGSGGFALSEGRVLYEIGSTPGHTARALARRLRMDEGYLSRIIKALERRKLVRRTPSPQDARAFRLDLTEDGAKGFEHVIRTAADAVKTMVEDLPSATIDQILEAMETVGGVLSWPMEDEPQVRELATGDLGWVVKRHGELYAAHEGFDLTFEALVAQIAADFVERANRPAENGWIAQAHGLRLGCVFVVADDSRTARLRLMLVEPFARGKGIGQTLVETAIAHARAQGFEEMVLWTKEGFTAACRLYARNGFRLTKSEPVNTFGRDAVDQTWELTL